MAGTTWALLPSVLIVEILSYLSPKDRLKATLACRRWRSYLFQPSLWPRLSINLHRNQRQKTKFLTDVCGRFVRDCVVKFDSHVEDEVRECFKILNILTENKNLQILQIQPSSCHIAWTENLTCERFVTRLEDVIHVAYKLKHLSVGCSEELLEHSGLLLELLSRRHCTSLESLHLASVKEDSENYGIIDLDIQQFRRFSNLKHLSIDYDFLDNQFLQIFADNHTSELLSLSLHVHGIDPEHEKVTNVTWRHLVSRCKNLEVTINLIHSFVGITNLLDILQPNLPLAHFRQFFCFHINLAALGLMATHYGQTLKSIHIVDGFQDDLPIVYETDGDEDPFVMLAWRCKLLEKLSIIGYELCERDIHGIARLRGKALRVLEVPESCIRWYPPDNDTWDVGGIGPEFATDVSSILGREWHPLVDDELPPAVYNVWADAEEAYGRLLLQDQCYRSNRKSTLETSN